MGILSYYVHVLLSNEVVTLLVGVAVVAAVGAGARSYYLWKRGRRREQRRFTLKLAALAAVICWLDVFVALGMAAGRHHLSGDQLYGTIECAVMGWFATTIWADKRREVSPNGPSPLRRALDGAQAAVIRVNVALFLWTPVLSAVLWSVFGARYHVAAAHGTGFWQANLVTYFMLAMLPTLILLRGIGELRHPRCLASAAVLRHHGRPALRGPYFT